MPRRQLSIAHDQRGPRLKATGRTSETIAQSVGTGKATVYEYLARPETAGGRLAAARVLEEEALQARLWPTGHAPKRRQSRAFSPCFVFLELRPAPFPSPFALE